MENQKGFTCTICGEYSNRGQGWFLIVEDSWLDRLKVLHWDETLAGHTQVHCLCSAPHVRELVAHWMATGSLAYPFASVSSPAQTVTIGSSHKHPDPGTEIKIQNDGLIGELAVHRESLERALSEHPQCLSTILEALLGALDHAPTGPKLSPMQEEELAVV